MKQEREERSQKLRHSKKTKTGDPRFLGRGVAFKEKSDQSSGELVIADRDGDTTSNPLPQGTLRKEFAEKSKPAKEGVVGDAETFFEKRGAVVLRILLSEGGHEKKDAPPVNTTTEKKTGRG